jgi:hypothetical protein
VRRDLSGATHTFSSAAWRSAGLGVDGGVARVVVKRALMVAFHYPPAFGSSGVQRALKFSQYLPEFGWLPLVLTAHPRAHANRSPAQLEDVPAEVIVKRAFALDAATHLAVRGAIRAASRCRIAGEAG